ncbi:hypothetical protein ACEQPO_15660 [Bacillus sp. SL00103]
MASPARGKLSISLKKPARLQLDVNMRCVVVLIDCHDESFMKQDQYKKVKEMPHLTHQK